MTGLEQTSAVVGVPAAPAPPALPDGGTRAAVGLAAATMAANAAGVAITIVFTRLLGTDGYGQLAALLNLMLILAVPGSALQVAAAREGARGRLGEGRELAGTFASWSRRLGAALAVATVAGVLARVPLADALNVDATWAAAAVPVTAGAWLLLCVYRGLLQARRAYRAVGLSLVLEAIGRLVVGVALAVAGLDVTGAYLGTTASFVVTALVLGLLLRRRLGPAGAGGARHRLRTLARGAGVPIAALVLIAVLQNVDVLVARHTLADDPAGIYAAAGVCAKALVWIAWGVGLWLLPEAAHRVAAGHEARAVLLRAAAVILAIAVPELVVYAVAPELVLEVAFGADYRPGAGVLLTLGVAYAFLAVTYIGVQYGMGLHRRAFLAVLALAALLQTVLLAGRDSTEGLAAVVLAVQAPAAVAVLALALRRR